MTKTRSSATSTSATSRMTPLKHQRLHKDFKGVNAANKGVNKVPNDQNVWTTMIRGPSEYWNNLVASNPDAKIPIPFTQDTVFGEGDTLHDLAKAAKAFFKPKQNVATTVEEWTTIFHECFDNPNLALNDNATMIRRLAVTLAWSDPTSIFDKGRWNDN